MKRNIRMGILAASLIGGAARAEESAAWSGTITAGYDTRYVLYGYRYARHLYHADTYLSRAATESVSLWGGGWYGCFSDGTYRELDLYGGADWTPRERWTLGLGYSLFNYFDAPFTEDDEGHEFTAYAIHTTGPFTLTLRDHYDLTAEGHLARAILAWTREWPARWTLDAEAEYGHAFHYYVEEDGPHHGQFKLSLSRPITETVSATAFVARTLALDALDEFERDDTFGGVSVTRSF